MNGSTGLYKKQLSVKIILLAAFAILISACGSTAPVQDVTFVITEGRLIGPDRIPQGATRLRLINNREQSVSLVLVKVAQNPIDFDRKIALQNPSNSPLSEKQTNIESINLSGNAISTQLVNLDGGNYLLFGTTLDENGNSQNSNRFTKLVTVAQPQPAKGQDFLATVTASNE